MATYMRVSRWTGWTRETSGKGHMAVEEYTAEEDEAIFVVLGSGWVLDDTGATRSIDAPIMLEWKSGDHVAYGFDGPSVRWSMRGKRKL